MRAWKLSISLFAIVGMLTLGLTNADAAKKDRVTWKRIVANHPNTIGGSEDSLLWTVREGRVELGLDDGRLKFNVRGLSVLTPEPDEAIGPPYGIPGTTSKVTKVRGTLVCNLTLPGFVELVDTTPVPLSQQGNAEFDGHLVLSAACTTEPEDLAFLIRIAELAPEVPPLAGLRVDQWIAQGAVRVLPHEQRRQDVDD